MTEPKNPEGVALIFHLPSKSLPKPTILTLSLTTKTGFAEPRSSSLSIVAVFPPSVITTSVNRTLVGVNSKRSPMAPAEQRRPAGHAMVSWRVVHMDSGARGPL